MYGYRQLKTGIFANGSDQALPLDGRISNQKLVRDDVVFQQARNGEAELREAIKRVENMNARESERETEPHVA